MVRPNRFKRLRRRDVKFVAQWEGFTPVAQHFDFDPPGVYTVGYGHTIGVRPGQRVTEREARKLLRSDLHDSVRTVKRLVNVPLSRNQFSALVSFVYNVGPGAFESSTLLVFLNKRYYALASGEFGKWVRGNGGVILPGLVNRRKAERILFNTK